MSTSARAQRIALVVAAALCAGCGKGGGSGPPPRAADRPAKPPPGWRTVANRTAGLTIAAPRRWTVRLKDGATLIRSPDRLAVVTIGADRTAPGRELPVAEYARETLQDLPGFDGSLSEHTGRVRGSPYRSAVVQGAGTVRTSHRPQRITVGAFHLSGRVTFVLVAFRNARFPSAFDASTIRRMLRSLRAGVPRR